MNIEEMNIDQIEERISQIETEKEAPEANFEALTEEVRQLKEQKDNIIAEAEKRQKELNEIAQGEVETVLKEKVEEERKTMTNKEIRNSAEYISAYANYIKTGKDEECRALLSENGSGKVPVPELVDDVIKTAWDREDITRLVKKTYLKGNLKVGFELSATGAAVHTEGADAPAEETLVLGITELVPQSIKKWITISDEVLDLSAESFLRYIYDELTYQIAKKAADALIADIEACGTVSTNSGTQHQCGVPKIAESTIAVGTIANALSQLSDQAANPVIMMNRSTYASFKQAQYAASWPVDVFEGLPVVFNNTIKAFAVATTGETFVIVGDLGYGAQMNMPNGDDITFKYDENSLAEKDLVKIVGRKYVGHDVVAPGAFVKVVMAE